MSQSEMIVAALLAGFVVWLAMNKRLGVYWSIMTGGAAASAGSGLNPGTGSEAPPSLVIPGTKTPGTPGLSVSPGAGLPNSWCNFLLGGMPGNKTIAPYVGC